MPKQIFDKEEFLKLADNAIECRIVRRKDKVKIKLRRVRMLYTYVADSNEADEIISKINVPKVEL